MITFSHIDSCVPAFRRQEMETDRIAKETTFVGCRELRLDPGLLSQFIAQHPTADFFIVSGSSRYQVDGFLASIHSERIARLFAADPYANSITVHPTFPADIAALRGEPVAVPDGALLSTIDIAAELLIDSLTESLAARVANVLPLEHAIALLRKAFDCRVFADCVAASLDRTAAQSLSNEQLDLVLQSPFLKATPVQVAPILRSRVDFARQPNHRLAKHLPVKEMMELEGANLNVFRFAMAQLLPPSKPDMSSLGGWAPPI
jgi:hypothetical protein